MHGENCVHPCSSNCAKGNCDRFNGSCSEGCKKPYIGKMCNKRKGTLFTLTLRYKSMPSKPLVFGGIFGACASFLILLTVTVLLIRRGIFRNCISRRRHSQTYVSTTETLQTTIETLQTSKDDSHNYQALHSSNDEGNYVSIESPKNDSHTYQELRVPKDNESYVIMKLETN
ncbi:uncharacterized protein LOC134243498 [Saccostrea cucullata]|uniref:uncharacterized protein LOC134243498 n=1 Tax=Saccostrea cuccullata TaxID=36930 RepID=UPI002ED58D0B